MARKFYFSLLMIATLVAAAAPAAQARKARCTPDPGSPRCHFWYGKVTLVADGDTIKVDVFGDHTREVERVRLTGINAPELHVYSHKRSHRRGECNGVSATNRLEDLIRQGQGHNVVRLAAQHPRSHSGVRKRRIVYSKIGGQWVNLNKIQLREGRALYLGNPQEWAWNRDFELLAEQAAMEGLRMYNPYSCGAGPMAAVTPAMKIHWDAQGNDYQNVNGEWARIYNPSDVALPLAGWWFRDSWKERYYFPDWAQVPPHGSITLKMGHGDNGGGIFHWGRPSPPFENPRPRRGKFGDGGYLFDRRGNLRAWVMYPCLMGSCAYAGAAGSSKLPDTE
jgi:micrococcal nuclease